MFVCNIKVNGKLWFKLLMFLMGFIVMVIFVWSIFKFFGAQNEFVSVNDETRHTDVTEIEPNNYTNILKAVHDDLDSYIGKEIKFSGYIYKVIDFTENQFVLARDMLIDSKSYVVGFLSEYEQLKTLEDGTWVEISGTITKGKYHNKVIPILKINTLSKIEKPDNAFVLPPSDTYIPTSAIL